METLPYPSVILSIVNQEISSEISLSMLLFTFFLVFLNGFFVAAEFAIVKVRSSQLEVKTDVNKNLANAAKSIVSHLDSYLAATQLGITLASLGLGWVGQSSLTPVIIKIFEILGLTSTEWLNIAHKVSFPIAFVIITILHIVFGELAPKSIAIRFPTKTTFTVAWPLKAFYFVFKPIIWVMNGFANLLLRMIGIKPIHGAEIHSEEELKVIILESQEGGAIEETERALIQNVFDFDDRRVFNIQTLRKNVSALSSNSTVNEATVFAISEGYSRYPIYEDSMDNIIGILYTKDLLKTMLEKQENTSVKDIIRKPFFISETSMIKNVLKQFQKKHIQMAIVTNEVGEFSGIVSMEDILEELVGEIQDEYDNEDPIVRRIKNGVYVVNAHHNLSDINKEIPYKFEESEYYETLAGLISEQCFDRELRDGDKIDLEKYNAIIVKMYRNSVEKLELRVKEEFLEEVDKTEE